MMSLPTKEKMVDGFISLDGLRCIIVFIRTPQIGKLKTRFSRTLGVEPVLRLYQSFFRDVIETAKKHTDHIRICYYYMETIARHTAATLNAILEEEGIKKGEI